MLPDEARDADDAYRPADVASTQACERLIAQEPSHAQAQVGGGAALQGPGKRGVERDRRASLRQIDVADADEVLAIDVSGGDLVHGPESEDKAHFLRYVCRV